MTTQLDSKKPLVIAIDGVSSSGKSSTGYKVAQALGFHFLDSGLIYRAGGWFCLRNRMEPTDSRLPELMSRLPLRFEGEQTICSNMDISDELHTPEVDKICRQVAQVLAVRQAIRCFQLSMRKSPGLVAVGRDMGEIFGPVGDPTSGPTFCFFLDAPVKTRAEWRFKQKKTDQSFGDILTDLIDRDHADKTREHSPLRVHSNAETITVSDFDQSGVVCHILKRIEVKKRSLGIP